MPPPASQGGQEWFLGPQSNLDNAAMVGKHTLSDFLGDTAVSGPSRGLVSCPIGSGGPWTCSSKLPFQPGLLTVP